MTKFYIPSARQTGTYNLNDLRGSGQIVAEFGVTNALAVLRSQLADYEATLNDSMRLLAGVTTERIESSGNSTPGRMVRVDEYGNAATQKSGGSVSRAFPLDCYQFSTGWTEHFEAVATMAQFMQLNDAAMLADTVNLREQLSIALYNNNPRDLTESHVLAPYAGSSVFTDVKVKPLYNGDGEVPPASPTGKKFTGTHSHYLASNGLTAEAVSALVQTVAEHSVGNRMVIAINEADAGAFRALPGFAPLLPAAVLPGANAVTGAGQLDVSQTDNRTIGYLTDGTAVATKPWAVAGYAVCMSLTGERAIKMRQPAQAVLRAFRLKGQEGNTTLKASTWERFVGFGVSNRGAAAVLKFTGNVYTRPSIGEQ